MLRPVLKGIRWFITLLMGVLVTTFGVLFVCLLVLSQRPLPLTPFLPWMQEKVAQNVPGLTFQKASLSWRKWDSPFEIRFENLTVAKDKTHVMRLKTLDVKLGFKALLEGKVQVKGLAFSRPQEVLETLLNTKGKGSSSTPQMVDEFLASPFWKQLETLEFTDVLLPSFVELEGVSYYLPPLDITLRKRDLRSLHIEVGYKNHSPVLKGQVSVDPSHNVQVTAQLTEWKVNLSPKLRIFKPAMHWLRQLPLLSATMKGTYDLSKNMLVSAQGELTLAPKQILLSQGMKQKKQHVNLGKSTASFHVTPKQLIVSKANLALEDTDFQLEGTFNLPSSKAPFSGKLNLSGPISVPFLAQVWPQQMAPKPRDWIITHMDHGQICNVTLKFGEKGGVSGTMDLEGFTVDYMPGMPKTTDVCGKATFDHKHFSIALSRATLQQQRLAEGHLDIKGMDQKDQTFSTRLVFEGPLSDVLTIVNHPPLALLKERKIEPNDFQGEAHTDLTLDFPLESNLETDQIRVRLQAHLKDVSTALKLDLKDKPELSITQGNLSLSVSNEDLVLQGPAQVDNQPAIIHWKEYFKKPGKSRYELL